MAQKDNDRYQKHAVPDDFPISTLGGYRGNLRAPEGEFDSEGSWTQRFGIHSVGTGSSRVGTLVLSRQVRGDGRVSLRVRHEKVLLGAAGARKPKGARARRVLQAVLQLGTGRTPLSTPRRWSFTTEVFDDAGQAIPEARLERRAVVEDGKLRITTGDDATRTVPLAGQYTVNWATFDAVGRLPRKPFEPIHFTLIDHFDQVKPDQTLLFRRAIETAVAGQTIQLHGFDQTGRGVMPWTYWVDNQGRVVVAISGLEAYMLESAST